MADYDNYPATQETGYIGQQLVRKATLKERLEMAVTEAKARLAEAEEARAIFERNPDLERLLDIMQRGRF